MPMTPSPWLTALVVTLTLGSTLALLRQRHKSDAELLFAMFCGSLALSMLRPWVDPQSGWLWWAVVVGGCATCNGFWLVSRALFRGDGAVRGPHIAVAGSIASMIVAYRWSALGAPWPGQGMAAIVGALLDLASSSILALTLVESLRGWSAAMPRPERRLRLSFVLVFGGCVLAATISGALANAFSPWATWHPSVVSLCAVSIVVYMQWALRQRRRHPLALPTAGSAAVMPTPTAEHESLAAGILHLLEHEQIYREPDLKVADLAERLGSAEHKVSRAITLALGERNFNALINRYRVAHACRLLAEPANARTVLEISLEAGFASLGPFNRAFKAATGCTPTRYRAERGAFDRSELEIMREA